jgi:glycosyltransferase involved in cell wall biosynthesis
MGRESLYAAIDSALKSIGISVEVIVVANNLREPLDFSRISSGVKVFESHECINGNQARNLGVEMASSPIVAFLDDDDLFLPNKLHLQYQVLKAIENTETLISCRYFQGLISKDIIYPIHTIKIKEDIASYLLKRTTLRNLHNSLPTSTWMGYRRIFLQTRFDEYLNVHQDWDWLIRAKMNNNFKIIQIEEPLVSYSISSPDSTSRRTNWEDSMSWYLSHRAMFSKDVGASYLLTNLHSRMVRSGDFNGAWRLLKSSIIEERPNFASILVALARHLFFYLKKKVKKV